jgi:hypothetical protein
VKAALAAGVADVAGDADLAGGDPLNPDLDSDMDTDGFDATDAAAGGEEELGRERR